VTSGEDEDQRVRAAALKTAESIVIARQRAERELLAAKEALERKSEELEQQRAWFEVTLNSIGDAVITTDVSGTITSMNPVAEAMTGWSVAEATGEPLERVFQIVNEDTCRTLENPVAKVLQLGKIVALANDTALIRKDGTEVAIEDSAAPIRDPTGNVCGAVMVFHDVTARRRVEQALRETDRRKDEFLATLAHELRNPLAPIRQAARILRSEGATESQKRWSQDVIDRQVQHMALLIDDLLDISRVTRGTLELRIESIDLAAVIEAAIETARPIIDAKRHQLSVETPQESVHFAADPLRVAQVLSNLLTNAAKYTDPEGQIRLRAASDGTTVTISVADTGIGIPPREIERVFTMFSQVKATQDRSDGGLGIGLALTKGLVELHAGTIEARSGGPGQGSEFIVRLPHRALNASTAREAAREAMAAATTTPARRRRILIADDNHDAAQSLAVLLKIEGHDVTVVSNGREALRSINAVQPEIALLDIGMPEMDGYEVARQVRQQTLGRAVTLVAVTGWGQDRDKARALGAGFNHHLTKPIEPTQLLELVRLSDASA
jgi:PAS domain S-box-containing protein